jgi:hypothetical protein
VAAVALLVSVTVVIVKIQQQWMLAMLATSVNSDYLNSAVGNAAA